ncbi:MAG: hypothetical protein E7399_02175 [Ruminococcaceae bacterium]|nr:hypothetical protein [Oscillospiraceae bacterium]
MHFQIPKQQWTKMEEYLEGLPQEELGEGMKQSDYLDLMEQILEGYDLSDTVDPNKDLQTYSRLVSVLACLLANGRKEEWKTLFCEMMTKACGVLPEYEGNTMLDFAVKELMFAYRFMKENDINGDWAKMLSSVTTEQYVYPSGEHHNINLYNVAGEALRTTEGLCDSAEYCKECLVLQLAKLDENGMYPDNYPAEQNPVLYDLASRFQLQLIEHFGRAPFDERLRRAGVWSLMTQSATGQIPYGGRSNQYLFNETLLASVLEYEAGKQAEDGNFVLAGRMRRGARLAVESIQEFLNCHSHNRNRYADSKVGCEEYGYYEKYMISAAAFLIGTVLFAREDLPEYPAPCEVGGYVLYTSPKFHQIFAAVCDYSIQIDTDGDPSYDATGLGRIHKIGIPASLGLSVPFSGNPRYHLPQECSPLSAAIGIGWDDGEGGVQYLSDLMGIKHALSIEEEKKDKLKFTVTYTGNVLKNCGGVMESYSLDEGGLRYSAKLLESECKAVYARVPLLVTDGERESRIKQKAGQTNVYLDDCRWRITTNASLIPDEVVTGNRNGVYKIVTLVRLEPKIRLNLSLCRENEEE